jgi:hypothetical protein
VSAARKPTPVAWSEAGIASRIAATFPLPTYASLMHVGNATGFANRGWLDVLVVGLWPSRGLVIYGFEIKVSRSDWRRELKAPEKAENLARYCDKFFIAAPEGVVPHAELPVGWGLYEATERTKGVVLVKEAPARQPEPLDRTFLAALMKRATEQTVPKADVDRQVHERLDAAKAQAERDGARQQGSRDWELDHAKAEAERLRKMVADFEAASGINLAMGYAGGAVGKAFVDALQWRSPEHLARRLDDAAKRIGELVASAQETAAELRAIRPPEPAGAEGDRS